MGVVEFKASLVARLAKIQVNHSGSLLSYQKYLELPATDRSGDEQAFVDAQITPMLLDLLGYDKSSGESVYNAGLKGRQNIPDFRVGVRMPSGHVRTVFPTEDKNSATPLDDLLGLHGAQVERYLKGLGTPAGLITNGRYVVGLTLSKTGVDPTFVVDLLEVLLLSTGGLVPLLPGLEDAPLNALFLRFRRDAFGNRRAYLDRIGRHPETIWKSTAKPIESHIDDFVDELSARIATIHSDVEAQLLGQLGTATRAWSQIEHAIDQATGLPLSARQQVETLSQALSTQVDQIKSKFESINSSLADIRGRIERLGKDPTNAVERSQVATDLAVLFKSKSADGDVKLARQTARTVLSLTERMSEAKTTLEIRYEKSLAVSARFENWYSLLSESLNIGSREDAIKEFALQAAYVYVVRLLLIRICEDKGLLVRRPLSDGGFRRLITVLRRYLRFSSGTGTSQLLAIAYENAQHIYSHFYGDQTLFDWYEPDENLFLETLVFLNDFNFAKVQQDVLGQVYERYAKSHGKENEGRFYTKRQIVDFMLDLIGISGKNLVGKRVIDPACGSGTFLVRSAPHWISSYKKGKLTPVEVIDKTVSSIWGMDINPFACYLAETNLLIQFLDLIRDARKSDPLFSGIQRFNIYSTNSLDKTYHLMPLMGSAELGDDAVAAAIKSKRDYISIDFSRGWDFVLANPPYVENTDAVKLYPVAKSNGNLYAAFTEFALDLLAPGGEACLITPTSWLNQDKYIDLRRMMLSRATLRYVVKCPYDMFQRAYVDNCIFAFGRGNAAGNYVKVDVRCAQAQKREDESWLRRKTIKFTDINSSRWQKDQKIRIVLLEDVLDFMEVARKNNWQRFASAYAVGASRGIITPKAISLLPTTSTGVNIKDYFLTSKPLNGFATGALYRYSLAYPPVFPKIDYSKSNVKEYKDPKTFSGGRGLVRRAVNRQFRLQVAAELSRSYVNNKDIYTLKPRPGSDPFLISGILNSRLASYSIVNLSEGAQKDDNTQVTQAEIDDFHVPPLTPAAKSAIRTRSRFLQRGSDALARLSKKGVEIHGIEGIGDHLSAKSAIHIDVKQLLKQFACYDWLSMEAAQRLSIDAPNGRTFAITQWTMQGDTLTFWRAKQQADLVFSSTSSATLARLYVECYQDEIVGKNIDEVIRSASIPKLDSDCDSVLATRAQIIKRVSEFLARLVQVDKEIDDLLIAAAALPKSVASAVENFPNSL